MDDEDIYRKDQQIKQQKLVWFLSLTGLVPFVLPALLVWVLGVGNPLSDPLIAMFRNYSVVILSFLGGIRWGHALLHKEDEHSQVDLSSVFISVLPSLLAWATMFLDTTLALSILLLAFCAQGAWDSFSAQVKKFPDWFVPIRMVLTCVVALTHAAMILISA